MAALRVSAPVEFDLAVTQQTVDSQHVRGRALHQLVLLVRRQVTQVDDVTRAVGQVTSGFVLAEESHAERLLQPLVAVILFFSLQQLQDNTQFRSNCLNK